ncbi:MAG: hypothetical protein ABSG13_05665 [Bryobacteraceae bacterium]
MRALLICLILFMAVLFVGAGTLAADNNKDAAKFSPGPASSYPARQTNDHVTVAAVAYDTEELAHTAFGKLNPNQYGVLPVLVIIQNDTDQALKLEHLDAEYTGVNGHQVEATPAGEVQTLGGTDRPNVPVASPIPIHRKHKNPLDVWEIDGRSFAAKLLPPHESANGFFYFQTTHRPGSKFYLSGIKVAATGQEIFYFEFPLENPK